MDLKIDPETMRQLVQKAVLDTMTPEAKDALLVKAIGSLFQADPSSIGVYGSKKTSPLEDLFAQQATLVARDVVRVELEKPENRQRIADMVVAAWQKMMGDSDRYEKAVDRMADALTAAMVDKEYR
jgi:hypothetical protein